MERTLSLYMKGMPIACIAGTLHVPEYVIAHHDKLLRRQVEQAGAFLKNLGIGFLYSQLRGQHPGIRQRQQAANIQLLPL